MKRINIFELFLSVEQMQQIIVFFNLFLFETKWICSIKCFLFQIYSKAVKQSKRAACSACAKSRELKAIVIITKWIVAITKFEYDGLITKWMVTITKFESNCNCFLLSTTYMNLQNINNNYTNESKYT